MFKDLNFQSALASDMYVDFLKSLKLVLLSAQRSDPTSDVVKQDLRQQAYALGRAHLERQTNAFDSLASKTAQNAIDLLAESVSVNSSKMTLSEASTRYTSELVDFYESEVLSQIERDIAQTLARLNDFGLEVFMLQKPGENINFALNRALLNVNIGSKYYSTDRAGRRRPSQRFIRKSHRHTQVVLSAQVFAMEASLLGAKSMTVDHPSQKAGVHGMEVGFRREQNLPLVSDLKDTVFHPNSEATLKAIF